MSLCENMLVLYMGGRQWYFFLPVTILNLKMCVERKKIFKTNPCWTRVKWKINKIRLANEVSNFPLDKFLS